ncbi:murein hydrolase activator EnvC family protein [Pseudoxanthomonas suwonensis]|uniref:Peptidase M23 n=1 Tax=Pseudoxanthomonas suwonensis TaxID=314722 RepID=A0A0E3UNC5_9GAMM|nr:peptidoglycan DD-metalloendopeptidase family protein [Pseudoxanthomonas suwonensis]AKC86840.1 peptidase M23 [Pseudoxanthomonas suwonensis]
MLSWLPSPVASAWAGGRLGAGLALALLLGLAVHPAQAQTQRATEQELRKARTELQQIARERRRLEGQRGDAAQKLRSADEQLGRSVRALAETEEGLRREREALAALQQQRQVMQRDLAQRRERLAGLLRSAYTAGPQAPLKLLLAQDRIADAQRALGYYRYAQREQLRQVAEITQGLEALAANEAEIAARTAQLETLQAEQQQQLAALKRDRGARAAVVAELDQRYQDRQQREQALGQDVKSLERLLANLRAAAARAEAERRAAAARAKQEQAAGRAATPGKVPPRVASATPPPRVGGLGWPASGELLARYGGRLPDGRTSSGVLIGAAAGSPVTAVADGTIVFSEWMTGYGLILIIDHGNGYMSLYAHNDALLRDAGDRVRRGDAIARVGSSGGHGRPALYFELRRNGQPVDPATWLQRR